MNCFFCFCAHVQIHCASMMPMEDGKWKPRPLYFWLWRHCQFYWVHFIFKTYLLNHLSSRLDHQMSHFYSLEQTNGGHEMDYGSILRSYLIAKFALRRIVFNVAKHEKRVKMLIDEQLFEQRLNYSIVWHDDGHITRIKSHQFSK